MSNFWTRLFTGAVFTGLLIVCIALSAWYLHVLMGLLALLTLQEYTQLFKKSKSSPDTILVPILGVLIYFFAIYDIYHLKDFQSISPYTISLLILAFPLLSFFELYRKKAHPFENVALGLLGIIYIVLPFVLLNLMAISSETGEVSEAWPVLAIFLIVWSNDTFAYLVGKQWGKNKLFERISPKKSWEGFVGGVVFAQLCAYIITLFTDDSFLEYSVYALVISTVGTIGDLIESMLKRSLSIKDSGKILPGHGGLLDRFDAVLFAIPVLYLLHTFLFSAY